jgi:ligand-binding SRPBCC domain-containing protein
MFMPPPRETILQDSILVRAPIDRVFALSTNIEIVQQTLGFKPFPATGHITSGSRVHWRGWLFGLPQKHHTLITAFDPPRFFQDSQEAGRFAHFHHDHHFTEVAEGTLLSDEVHFTLPFGVLGALVAKHLIAPHTRRLLRARFQLLKRLAEGPDETWRRYTHLHAGASKLAGETR